MESFSYLFRGVGTSKGVDWTCDVTVSRWWVGLVELSETCYTFKAESLKPDSREYCPWQLQSCGNLSSGFSCVNSIVCAPLTRHLRSYNKKKRNQELGWKESGKLKKRALYFQHIVFIYLFSVAIHLWTRLAAVCHYHWMYRMF